MGGGAIIAIDAVNSLHPLADGYTLNPTWYMPGCNDAESLKAVVKASLASTHGFIGPECSKSVESIALLARGWNTALVSYGASTPTVSNHEIYQTFARSIPPYNFMGEAIAQLLLYYNWDKHICILTSVEDIWLRTADKFISSMERAGIQDIQQQYIFPSDLSKATAESRIKEILEGLHDLARVVVLLTYDDAKVLSYAFKLGMLTGDYVFIVVEGSADYLQTNLSGEDTSQVLTGLFSVTYRPLDNTSDMYRRFKEDLIEVADRLNSEEEDKRLPPADDPVEIIYEAFIHDAVMLFAVGLNNTIKEKKFKKNVIEGFGKDIRDKISELVIEGVSGSLNMSGGDRRSDFLIQNYQGNQFNNVFLYTQANNALKKTRSVVFPGGSTVSPDKCGRNGELCKLLDQRERMVIIVCSAVIASIFLVILSAMLVWKIQHRTKVYRRMWEIKLTDVVFYNESAAGGKGGQGLSALSLPSISSFYTGNTANFSNRAHIKNKTVYLKRTKKQFLTLNDRILQECQQVWEARHANIAEFIGVCITPENIFIATAFCSKRSLQDLLSDDRVKLDLMFKMALSTDLVKGLMYIHRSAIEYHGNLTSSNCLVDDHWTLKLTDFGMRCLRRTLGDNVLKSGRALTEAELWRAPEFLYTAKHTGSQAGDVYSVGIILQEIICEDCPYPNCHYTTEEILEKVPVGFRPKIAHDHASNDFIDVIERCWEGDPGRRIGLPEIKNILYDLNPDRRISLTDRMLKMMNKYTNQLEVLVEERTLQLADEKDRADQLLYSMLPRAVAEKLKVGEHVPAEAFEKASIYFSDIVGFTDMSRASTPFQVVDFLNDLYTVFDDLIGKFDCYKVETIGDAYMVVSGIPQRNEERHCHEIAAMSLQFLDSINSFTVRHRPADKLKLRIGLHTGPCAAGVVGLKMPRYCLFGDTVNTASRMESTGLPSMIHTSASFYQHLQDQGNFLFEDRGEMLIKGKGMMRTYFLLGTKTTPQQPTNPALLTPPTRPRTLAPLHHKPAEVLTVEHSHNPTLVVTPVNTGKQTGTVSINNTAGTHPTPICA
ncbi:atrial natriuretic peptide receptor 2-like [Bolinopsis microptera]|uniref:atrial natriuretic peptide receptor 2-like n=1 Tax=Bolinopsis microptera TaxID=2820187 RepID=UPI00307A266E